MGKEMAGCMWGEDISRADREAPDDSGHPAANAWEGGLTRAELDKSCKEVVEEIRLEGSLSPLFRTRASQNQGAGREVLESRKSCGGRTIL